MIFEKAAPSWKKKFAFFPVCVFEHEASGVRKYAWLEFYEVRKTRNCNSTTCVERRALKSKEVFKYIHVNFL